MENVAPFVAIAAIVKLVIDWIKRFIPETKFTWEPIVAVILSTAVSWLFSVNLFVLFTDVTDPIKFWISTILTGVVIGGTSNGLNNLADILKGLKK